MKDALPASPEHQVRGTDTAIADAIGQHAESGREGWRFTPEQAG